MANSQAPHGGVLDCGAVEPRTTRKRCRRAPSMTAADLSSRPAPGALARAAAVLTRRNEFALILALLVIIAFFAVASPYFFTVRNLANVLGQASLAMIAGIGVAIVFLSGAVALRLIVIMNTTESLGLGVAGAIALGLTVGLVNGYLSAYVGINSLIVTL